MSREDTPLWICATNGPQKNTSYRVFKSFPRVVRILQFMESSDELYVKQNR